MNGISPSVTAVLVTVLIACTAYAQEVIRYPDPGTPLEQRWEWASPESRDACAHGCWVGYGIRRLMEPNSYVGWSTDRQRPTLQALVYGREVEPVPSRLKGDANRGAATTPVLKEVAMLFRYEAGTLREINLSSISLSVDLDGLPLIWLGLADQPQSVQHLTDEYEGTSEYTGTSNTDLQEELVSAVGMHDADDLVVSFLTQVLRSDAHDEVREQSVFWLAEAQHDSVLPLLARTARGDASEDVRDQAVFGISRIESDEAGELLIDLARGLEDRETREQAIFWLGQKASEKAAENLEEIAVSDPDLEIQKKAVFAISQLPKDDGVPRLISIVRTHRSAKVRHEAIFWLGESGDERAVDELVRIVRGR